MSYLERLGAMCSLHRATWAYAAADHLDSPDLVDLARTFGRYEGKCAAGDGCER